MGILRSSGVSCYVQLSEILKKEIEDGRYPAGTRLPGEMELARRYGLNRHTVRAALQELVKDDYIYRLQGRGTFVALKKIPYAVARDTHFSESVRLAGQDSRSQVLEAYEVPCDPETAGMMRLAEGVPLLILEILRFIKDVPVGYTVTRLPAKRFPDLREHLKGSFSLYRVLREQYSVVAQRARATIETTMPTRNDQEMLCMPAGVPILFVCTLGADTSGRPVEYSRTRARGDAYNMTVDFMRLPEEAADAAGDRQDSEKKE